VEHFPLGNSLVKAIRDRDASWESSDVALQDLILAVWNHATFRWAPGIPLGAGAHDLCVPPALTFVTTTDLQRRLTDARCRE